MKYCNICEQEKPLEEFSWKNKTKGTKTSRCKECQRAYAKAHYSENKEYYVEKSRRLNNKYRLINRQYVWDYLKSNPCVDCGENDPVVLEFDHKRAKKGNVSVMIWQTTLPAIKKEIEKCEVVCSNCHKRRTAKQFDFYGGVVK